MPLQGFLRRQRPSDPDSSSRRRSVSLVPPQPARDGATASSDRLVPPRPSNSPYLAVASPAFTNASADVLPTPSSARSRESVSPQPSMEAIDLDGRGSLRRPRLSFMNFRHASDSQLAATARRQAAHAEQSPRLSDLMPTPAIITTAPTMDVQSKTSRRRPRLRLPEKLRVSSEALSQTDAAVRRRSMAKEPFGTDSLRASRVTFHEPDRQSTSTPAEPPPYADLSSSSLALPTTRMSESSRSDGSTGEPVAYATTTTTHTVSTTTTFFRLPRRKKNPAPLFPLPTKVSASESTLPSATASRASTSKTRLAPSPSPTPSSAAHTTPQPSPTRQASGRPSTDDTTPVPRKNSAQSVRSSRSSPSRRPPLRLSRRGRSSTINSLNAAADESTVPTPPLPSGRTSTSTTGRPSIGGIFNFSHRSRHESESPFPRHGSPATPAETASKANSFNLPREPLFIPEREPDDTPVKYLARLEEAVSRGVVASILSRSNDAFSKAVLRSYMRSFAFFEDPMDMAIRKLLMEVELPKETQQIDRVLQSFADRYHECNPGIYTSPDQAYFIAFSLLILHTDVFNKNNKHKMLKADYLKNTKGEGMSEDVLECFYDNISYTPFIHVEDDLDINGERIVAHKSSKNLFSRRSSDAARRPPKGPVDPYALIIDRKLDTLRPVLKEVMSMNDPYSYLGTATALDLDNLQRTFFKSGVLQIVSARSRPDAFKSPNTISNPDEAHPGVVDIKITKVGVLWRKDVKKKKARSPWQEWGAILTGAQLYFFRNTTWVKNLMHQYDSHHKQNAAGLPVVFKPPLENFKPDALMTTDGAVALLDANYKKHKHAFTFVRQGMFEETFLADNERDMNDWLAKLNYAASFRTAGVRMRGLVGNAAETRRSRGVRRRETNDSTQSVPSFNADASSSNGRYEAPVAQQVWVTRRQIMTQKIAAAEEKMAALQKSLDGQLRNARHLQILAPVQVKTHEQILLAAGRLAATIKWTRIEMWRLKCHKEILALDLEADYRADGVLPPSAARDASRSGASRIDSKRASVESAYRTQLATGQTADGPQRSHGLDDIFQPPAELTKRVSQHRPQGSWELPPLSFALPTAHTSGPTSTPAGASAEAVDESSIGTADGESTATEAVRMATHPQSAENEELEVLKEAGLVQPTVTGSSIGRPAQDGASDVDDMTDVSPRKPIEVSDGGDKARLRRTLHRTLRDTPTHHRSRKGKDSASSSALTEEGQPGPESEGLARGTGSFVLHGKKASVVNFGSEWHDMSPEERLKMRKQSHSEGSSATTAAKLTVSNVDDDDDSSVRDSKRTSFNSPNARAVVREHLLSPQTPADAVSLASRRNSESRRSTLTAIPDHDDGEVVGYDSRSEDSRGENPPRNRNGPEQDPHSHSHSPVLAAQPQMVPA